MKSILVPTDFSTCADKAFQFALAIAAKWNLPITLLHVTSSEDADDDESDTAGNTAVAAGTSQLEGLKQKAPENVIVRTHTVQGKIADAILEAAKTFAADFIVMGTQGATGIRKMVVGSKTAAVIQQSNVPVLSIPAGYEGDTFKEVLLAINNADEDLQNLAPLFQLAGIFNARVRLAIFTGKDDEAVNYISDRRTITQIQRKLQDLYQQPGIEVEHLSGASFEETLQAYITEHHIDLLAMITHRRGFLTSLFKRSVTKQMVYQATLPLLTLQGRPATLLS